MYLSKIYNANADDIENVSSISSSLKQTELSEISKVKPVTYFKMSKHILAALHLIKHLLHLCPSCLFLWRKLWTF